MDTGITPPLNREPHDVTDACSHYHCTWHQRDEPTEGYRLCAECGHMFGSDAELVAELFKQDTIAYINGWTANPPREQDPEQIYACPHCAHDF